MPRMRYLSTLALGAAVAIAVPLCAAQAGGHPARSVMSANQRAADLMNTINKSEIGTASMIADRTRNERVKDFADMLVNDHKQAQTDLESVASAGNINLREERPMMQDEKAAEEHLRSQPRAEADRAFVASEVRGHEDAIRQLQRLEPRITDPQLRAEVKNILPVLHKHLDHARKLEAELGRSK